MSGIITNKESLTTKLTLIIIGLTAGSGLLIPATYASFHPVTTGEIADNTILSVDIRNGEVRTQDIATDAVTSGRISDTNGVYSVDIVDGQVTAADIADDAVRPTITNALSQVNVPAGGYAFAKASCPAGTVLTGGGYSTSPYVVVYQNMPYNLTMWHLTGYNPGTQDDLMTSIAVCIRLTP